MDVRTVRLDDEDERTLAAVCKRTGLTITEILKRGLCAYDEASRQEAATRPYDVYRRLDLGPGGYSQAPASDAKPTLARVIAAKHRR